jgi:very-short-patch-repair endonuclease
MSTQLYARQTNGALTRAHRLRREKTDAEDRLLNALRSAFPALKWHHHIPVGPDYADILCFSAKLIIEVDGERPVLDGTRAREFQGGGYRVLRCRQTDVLGNPDGVIATVAQVVGEAPRPDGIDGAAR